ncbi:hypothetical protein Hanom_Chr17g01582561 [Helianthus anomalus]
MSPPRKSSSLGAWWLLMSESTKLPTPSWLSFPVLVQPAPQNIYYSKFVPV